MHEGAEQVLWLMFGVVLAWLTLRPFARHS